MRNKKQLRKPFQWGFAGILKKGLFLKKRAEGGFGCFDGRIGLYFSLRPNPV
jgi:hypothetical protein